MANFLKSLFVKGVEIDPAGASSDQVLKYNGTKFVPGTASTVGSIDDLSDVVITSPLEYQILEYNGTNWVNANAPSSVFVRNAEATTLTTGTVVYLFGATGDHATVKRADNDSDATSAKTVGVVSAPIAASENGVVVTQGYVDGIDLSVGYASGDVLWLGEDGGFTKTKPSAPEHLVFIGVVVRATNNGIIYVATQNGYELDELHNVAITSPTSGQVLTYNGSLWTNASASGGNVVSDSPPSSPTTGQVWFESDTGKTFIYYDSYWVEISGGRGDTNPVGAVTAFAGATAPASWLLCYGQAVSRTTYATLFSVIGTTYNTGGEAGTDFRLPDLRGRTVAGIDNMGGTDAGRLDIANSSGTVVGTQYVTLTSAQSGVPAHSHANTASFTGTAASHGHGISDPSHAHSVSDPTHSHGMQDMGANPSDNTGTNGYVLTGASLDTQGGFRAIQAAGTGIGIFGAFTGVNVTDTSITPAGSVTMSNVANTAANAASAHDNMQPTMVLNYIIKAL